MTIFRSKAPAFIAAEVLSLLLSGCANPADDAKAAERQYEMVKRAGGSKQEICDAARMVADAWLRAENQQEYKLWDVFSDIDCNAVVVEKLLNR